MAGSGAPSGPSTRTWREVDDLVVRTLGLGTPGLGEAVRESAGARLPPAQVSPALGQLLRLLCRVRGARRVLEVGTLGGVGALWLARALPPGGRVVTLEIDPDRAAVARRTLDRAGLAEAVEVRVGPAEASLQALAAERADPFDLVFIDADRPGAATYLRLALFLSQPGTVVVCDNVVRAGTVLDPVTPDARGARALLQALADEPDLDATVIQTVGAKGHDGFALAVVGGPPRSGVAPARSPTHESGPSRPNPTHQSERPPTPCVPPSSP